MTEDRKATVWQKVFIDSFGQDVPWQFRSDEETRDRWARELCAAVHRYSDEFMRDVVTWAAKNFERKSKKAITLPELKDMCFAFLSRNKRDGGEIKKDERTRLQSLCIRVRNAALLEKDIFKAWDLLCDAGSDYNCRMIHRWAEEQLGVDFAPVAKVYEDRRIEAMSGAGRGVSDVRRENERDQYAWMNDLANSTTKPNQAFEQEMGLDDVDF